MKKRKRTIVVGIIAIILGILFSSLWKLNNSKQIEIARYYPIDEEDFEFLQKWVDKIVKNDYDNDEFEELKRVGFEFTVQDDFVKIYNPHRFCTVTYTFSNQEYTRDTQIEAAWFYDLIAIDIFLSTFAIIMLIYLGIQISIQKKKN